MEFKRIEAKDVEQEARRSVGNPDELRGSVARSKADVAFLFLGETLLLPHLYPIAEAIGKYSDLIVDLWVSTSVHERLLTRWTRSVDPDRIRIRRAPGFRVVADDAAGRNPRLPAKLPMLARLLPHIWRTPVVVCAEQTSLWLPTLLPLRARFVKTSHGAGSMSARDDRRRRAAHFMMVPGPAERQSYLDRGHDPDHVVATGYVKAAFRQRTHITSPFADRRPILLYTPHWQAHRSSWPRWGRQIVEMLAAQRDYNVILAPHQRLIETAPDVRDLLQSVRHLPHIHCDIDSFAMVDGSYTELADIYLGDTSSQVVEYMMRPRPCIFLNPDHAAWQGDPSFGQWHCGQVVDTLEELPAALERARAIQPGFDARQRRFVDDALGEHRGDAARLAAEMIEDLVRMA